MSLLDTRVILTLGNLTRIGPNDLVTNDPTIIRRMSAVRSPYTRSDWYNATAFSHTLNHVFCERDEERHVDLRNKLIPGVSLLDSDWSDDSTPAKKTCISSRASTTSLSASSASFELRIPPLNRIDRSTWPGCASFLHLM